MDIIRPGPLNFCPPNGENYGEAVFLALAGIDTETLRASDLINTELQGQFL